jgi:tetratricopeptide (TPR) repeat protein
VPKHVAATDPETAKRAAAISNISIGLPRHFMGRDAEFARIKSALQLQEGRVAIMALRGLRGVGKTTLAVAYAEAHRGDYRATWWIRAHTVTTLRADIIALGIRIGWLAGNELALPEQSAVAAVTERLREEGEGILLIFDHAIDPNELKPYLPRGGASKALITTNAHTLRAIAEPLEIHLWSKDVGADFLIARTGRERERAAALALSETLGGLPLALEQAAAYCERLNIPLATYHEHFRKNPAQLLDSKYDASVDFHDGLTVAQAFALAIEQSAKLHLGAEPLMVHIALLGADQIPLFLFAEGRDSLSKEIATTLANDSLDEAIGALGMFALIDRETVTDERNSSMTTDVVHLHRLVREVVIDRTPKDALENAYRSLVATLAAVYPEDIMNAETWPRVRRLDALALAMVGSDRPLPKDSEKSVVKLLYGLAAYRHYALGAYAEARPFYERALAMRQRTLGPDDLETAESLNDLAIVAEEQRDLSGARSFYKRALAIREKLDRCSPDTAESLNGLARVLHDQGEFAEARSLYERALAIREKAQEPSELAESLDNYATLLHDQKDLAGARLHYKRALHIREGLRNDSDTAETLEHLATLLSEVGEFDEARSLYERALLINENILDPKHPVKVENIRSLANLLNKMGRTGEAESLLQRIVKASPQQPQSR